MKRRTAVVSGALAFNMRRQRAASGGELGLEILTLPQLAARLAGGFIQPAASDVLHAAIRAALAQGGFAEIEAVRSLPGMTRAVARTLGACWRADIRLVERARESPRLADLALIEARTRASLPAAYLIPPDLRDAAMNRLEHAPALFGEILLEDMLDVDLVWRPLVSALAAAQPVAWRSAGDIDRRWFPGELIPAPAAEPKASVAVVCADPRAEVVEALRWARGLLARGDVQASEVAIAATSTEIWDEHMLALSREAGLPVLFSHGVPALDTRDGQACAALADILLSGLSQARLRRLLRRAPPPGLPDDWSRGLRRAAGLFTQAHWLRALANSQAARASGQAAETVLAPLLALLAQGVAAAAEAGEWVLQGRALRLWREALQAAPAEALELSLAALRVPDPSPVGASITWGPAGHLGAAPRSYVRLLGLTSRGWPRPPAEDPLLPDHILPRGEIEPTPRPELDRILFQVIAGAASGELALSRSRRSAEGQLLPPSRLWPAAGGRMLMRTRIPEHAFSETDRLLARPEEAAARPRLALSRLCWRNWAAADLTPHDGALPPQHPIVGQALGRAQSTTSLRRLLRDPLGYVWRDILGWRPVETAGERLVLDARVFGELVHELLRRAVDHLEPHPGLARATPAEIRAAVDVGAAAVAETWPLERPIPPLFLWQRTLDRAASLALSGLTFDESFQAGTRSWTELAFGGAEDAVEDAPWNVGQPVVLAGLRLSGRIDRLDLRASGDAVRLTDYKTEAAPRGADRIVVKQGAELQRVVYAAAVRQLLPEVRQVISRLVYLGGDPSQQKLAGDVLDAAVTEIAGYVEAAVALLRAGAAPPGPDTGGAFKEMRLALPADLDLYLRRKSAAIEAAGGQLVTLWTRP